MDAGDTGVRSLVGGGAVPFACECLGALHVLTVRQASAQQITTRKSMLGGLLPNVWMEALGRGVAKGERVKSLLLPPVCSAGAEADALRLNLGIRHYDWLRKEEKITGVYCLGLFAGDSSPSLSSARGSSAKACTTSHLDFGAEPRAWEAKSLKSRPIVPPQNEPSSGASKLA